MLWWPTEVLLTCCNADVFVALAKLIGYAMEKLMLDVLLGKVLATKHNILVSMSMLRVTCHLHWSQNAVYVTERKNRVFFFNKCMIHLLFSGIYFRLQMLAWTVAYMPQITVKTKTKNKTEKSSAMTFSFLSASWQVWYTILI